MRQKQNEAARFLFSVGIHVFVLYFFQRPCFVFVLVFVCVLFFFEYRGPSRSKASKHGVRRQPIDTNSDTKERDGTNETKKKKKKKKKKKNQKEKKRIWMQPPNETVPFLFFF